MHRRSVCYGLSRSRAEREPNPPAAARPSQDATLLIGARHAYHHTICILLLPPASVAAARLLANSPPPSARRRTGPQHWASSLLPWPPCARDSAAPSVCGLSHRRDRRPTNIYSAVARPPPIAIAAPQRYRALGASYPTATQALRLHDQTLLHHGAPTVHPLPQLSDYRDALAAP